MDLAHKDNTGTAPPVHIRHQLEVIAAHGVSSDQLLQWYYVIKPPHAETHNSHLEQRGNVTAVSDNSFRYHCPWCKKSLKRPKDFVRHVEQTCFVAQKYRCPEEGCLKTFPRPDRFKNHHKKHHRCGRGSCKHHQQALVSVTHGPTPACGFCGDTFDLDIKGFLRHLIAHYRQGVTMEAWDPDRYISPATEALPPQVELSQALGDYAAASDFSPLLSAFGSQVVQQSSSSATAYYSGTALGNATYAAMAPTNPTDMGPGLRYDFNSSEHFSNLSPGSAPDDGTYYLRRSGSQQRVNVDENLYGIGTHASDGYPLLPNECDFTDQTTAQATNRDSSTTVQACVSLASAAELESSFESMEHMMPPFNVTPPLPPPEGHRRTLSARLLRALQSLP